MGRDPFGRRGRSGDLPAGLMTLCCRGQGISQMHVSRLLAHALGYLRERVTGPTPPHHADRLDHATYAAGGGAVVA